MNQEDTEIEFVEVKQENVREYLEEEDENYEKNIDDQDETNYQKCMSTNFQIEENSSKDEDNSPIGEKEANLSSQILTTEYQCTLCDRVYTKKESLRAHFLKHGEKKFWCSVCGRGFFTKVLMDHHSRVHTGLRPHVCNECGKTFSQVGNLRRHQLIHTGEKPHVCSVCGMAFTQRTHLKDHIMIIHTGEKPHSCEVCSKTFTRPPDLKSHMRIHTGERPYICAVCSKAFVQLSGLKRHMKTHRRNKRDPLRKKFSILESILLN